MLRDFTSTYLPHEAWLYDAVVAPAVAEVTAALLGRFADRLDHGARVLEVGCGGGQLARAVSRVRPDVDWTGLDLSPAQVARARRRMRAAGLRSRFVVGDALALPFDAGAFDAVVSVASLKHWPDPARGLAECVRVVRPGGALLVAEVDRGCRHVDARAFVGAWRLPPPARPLALLFFRTYVAGRSLDRDEVAALAAGLPLDAVAVERVADTPALLLSARRREKGPR